MDQAQVGWWEDILPLTALWQQEAPSKVEEAQGLSLTYVLTPLPSEERGALGDLLDRADPEWHRQESLANINFIFWLIADTHGQSRPVGFMPVTARAVRADWGPVERVELDVDFVWLEPEFRGARLGLQFAFALKGWLAGARAHGPRVVEGGAMLDIFSHVSSAAGARFASNLTRPCYQLLEQTLAGDPPQDIGWALQSVSFEISAL